MSYVGRFAPSPTGPLHFGSLVAAMASYLDARAARGKWLVRIEDIDQPRAVKGAGEDILRTLERYGFEWDGEVVWQSQRTDLYQAAFERLRDTGSVFGCACSRKEAGDDIYPGTCRNGLSDGRQARSWRVRVPGEPLNSVAGAFTDETIGFVDRVQGSYWENIAAETGDFVILRADGLFAYQLAVVVDDGVQGVTDVVRGADLIGSTARQILLQRLLGLPSVSYAHVPVAVNEAGEKLSKQTGAAALPKADPMNALRRSLAFLGQPTVAAEDVKGFWPAAIQGWDAARIPRRLVGGLG